MGSDEFARGVGYTAAVVPNILQQNGLEEIRSIGCEGRVRGPETPDVCSGVMESWDPFFWRLEFRRTGRDVETWAD